ncbi:MAG: three-Cys-motif partner protein TcmP [Gammaproteobacteria bacterium]|nr:three-Cys-motif partner protein TcmP [Gammaproteobacteria bacterium]
MAVELYKYGGREQSYIKHEFLTQYLQAAAYKTLQGRSPIFNFVDAFAGPWRVSETDYSDASFDQALQTLEAVRADLGRSGVAGLKVRFCFCEKRAEAVDQLREYSKAHDSFEIHVFHGRFEDRLSDIASACREGFTFAFIDPTGWDIQSEPVFEFLRTQNGEFLINFMSEHVNRHVTYSAVSESFGRFLADPEWSKQFNDLPEKWSNERRVLHLLREKLKDVGAATYVADFPIQKPRENRVKMRLVLGTHSVKGLEVFRDTQEKVERREQETHEQLRSESGDQISLFTHDEIAAIQQQRAGIGCPAYQRQAETRIVRQLSKSGNTTFHALSTDILENIPMRLTHIKSLVAEMRRRGVLYFDLPPRKRVPQSNTNVSLVASQTTD